MKFYIASHSQARAHELKRFLEATGHTVVARWILSDSKFGHGVDAYTDEERRNLAVMDEEDVRSADALVLISEADGQFVPGGKHVETGIALALQQSVFVIGRRENLFHWHPRVRVVPDIDAFLVELQRFASESQR